MTVPVPRSRLAETCCANPCASTTPLISGRMMGAPIPHVFVAFQDRLEPLLVRSCHQLVSQAPLFEPDFVGQAFRHHMFTKGLLGCWVVGWRSGSGPLPLTQIIDGLLN